MDRAAKAIDQAAKRVGLRRKTRRDKIREAGAKLGLDKRASVFRRAVLPKTSRGDAAAATWIFCGNESRGRGRVDILWKRVARLRCSRCCGSRRRSRGSGRELAP